ncbi:MAG: SIMPL domain-containing protein [Sedimenticola sp.]|nr:SIMPL domain-containing protein [Sedimenticola sp.]
MSRFFLIVWALLSATALADTHPPSYDRITLSASAGESVENDILIATLYAQQEGNNPTKLSSQINQAISQAIAITKQQPEIKVQTMDYTTNPIYRNNTLSGWRVRQSIRLESKNATAISQLIGTLQDSLQLGSTQYTVSPERRQHVQDHLTSKAIQSFRKRAELITREMGHQTYRLVQLQINERGTSPRNYAMQGMALRAEAAPTLEAGSQRLEVQINGTIELQPK